VKTLAAALTSRSHSLASLSELLKVPTPKKDSDEHGGALTPDYVRYGLRDVQTTWECFDALARRFATFGLHETGLYELYSEASLGKAYLRTMGLKPWQEVQRGLERRHCLRRRRIGIFGQSVSSALAIGNPRKSMERK
jgi:hypothetical protein